MPQCHGLVRTLHPGAPLTFCFLFSVVCFQKHGKDFSVSRHAPKSPSSLVSTDMWKISGFRYFGVLNQPPHWGLNHCTPKGTKHQNSRKIPIIFHFGKYWETNGSTIQKHCWIEEVSFEWSNHRISSTASKVRTLLHKLLTLGVKGSILHLFVIIVY